MNRIEIRSYIRERGEFIQAVDVPRYAGDQDHVPGAISFKVDGAELMGLDLWDDINWLWPYVVRAVDEYRTSGSGKRAFPDQPIAFAVEAAWSGTALVGVSDGNSIARTATVPDHELFAEVRRAGLLFFRDLDRLCPGTHYGAEESAILLRWGT